MAWGPDKSLYVADADNSVVRRISPDGTTPAGRRQPGPGRRLGPPRGRAGDPDRSGESDGRRGGAGRQSVHRRSGPQSRLQGDQPGAGGRHQPRSPDRGGRPRRTTWAPRRTARWRCRRRSTRRAGSRSARTGRSTSATRSTARSVRSPPTARSTPSGGRARSASTATTRTPGRPTSTEPLGIAVAPDNTVYFSDVSNVCVRKINPQGRCPPSLACAARATGPVGAGFALGDGGPATQASFASSPPTNSIIVPSGRAASTSAAAGRYRPGRRREPVHRRYLQQPRPEGDPGRHDHVHRRHGRLGGRHRQSR